MALPNLTSLLYRLIHGGILNYVEPSTTQAAGTFQVPLVVAVNTSNFAINFATLFPALTAASTVALTLVEITSPGLGFGFLAQSGGTVIPVRANSFISWGGNSLPTVYVNNTSLTSALQLTAIVSGA